MPGTRSKALSGRTIRCILFDLGNTLWTHGDPAIWSRLENEANQRAITLIHTFAPSNQFSGSDDATLGQRLRTELHEATRSIIRQNRGIEPDGVRVIQQILQHWGIQDAPTSLPSDIFEALRVRIPESRPLFHDTLDTLEKLKQRGFLLGVVTNRLWGGQPFQEDLRTLGLLHYFDPRNIAVSADLGIRKPDPAIFMHTLNALQVAPENAVMVGDSLSADIAGAHQLGIFTIWKPKPGSLQRRLALKHARVYRQKNATSYPTPAPAPIQTPKDQTPEHARADLQPGDDEALLQPGHADRSQQSEQQEIRPDLIIEYVCDLLPILKKAGPF